MSWVKEASKRVAEAHWSKGPSGASLSANRKWLMESDVRLSERFRDRIADYLMKYSAKVDPDNRHPAEAWRDGGDGVYIFANSRIGGHPAMEFAIRIPNGPFLQFGYGGKQGIDIQEHRSGKKIEIPHPLPKDLRTPGDVGEMLMTKMREFVEDEDNWGQPGSAMPL